MDRKNDGISLKKEWIDYMILVLFCLFVFGIRLVHISSLNGPFMFDDEAGYWSHAANLSGLSWTEVEHMWYSYGYSILLMPFFWITHNMSVLYKLAIGLNAVMGVGSFLLGIGIINELDIQVKKIVKYSICLVATCYSGYLCQSNIAWTETIIYFLFLLVIYLGIRFIKKTSMPNIIYFTVSVMALYIIHNRNAAIVIAFFMLIAFMLVRRKISWKHLVVSVGITAAVFVFNRWMKGYLSVLMWNSSDGFYGNDIAAEGGKLGLFFSISGWKKLIESFLGKIWYIFTSTLGVGALGFIFIFDQIISMIKNKEKKQGNKLESFLFILLSVLGTLAISVIATTSFDPHTSESVRLDPLIYGRYMEMLTYIFILFGLLYLFGKKSKMKFFLSLLCCVILYGASAWALNWRISNIESGYFLNKACVPGILFNYQFLYNNYSLICLAIMVIIMILVLHGGINEKVNRRFGLAACLVMLVIFVRSGQIGYAVTTEPLQTGYNGYAESYEILCKNTEYPVYYQGDSHFVRQGIRTRSVESVLYFSAPKESDNDYFYVVSKDKFDDLREKNADYSFVAQVHGECLLIKGQDIRDSLNEKNIPYYSMDKVGFLSSENFKLSAAQDTEVVLTSKKDISLEVFLRTEEDDVLMNDSTYYLSYHIYDTNGEALYYNGERTIIHDIGKDSIKITIPYEHADGEKAFYVDIDVVEEGVKWMSSAGLEMVRYYVIAE